MGITFTDSVGGKQEMRANKEIYSLWLTDRMNQSGIHCNGLDIHSGEEVKCEDNGHSC